MLFAYKEAWIIKLCKWGAEKALLRGAIEGVLDDTGR
jgi:hypothetical protein